MDDPLVAIQGSVELAEMIGGRHRVVKDVGHSIPAEVPKEFIDIMFRFLSDRWTDMPEAI
jgi:pimeloyl-ACP methyl ester carboxylesterase